MRKTLVSVMAGVWLLSAGMSGAEAASMARVRSGDAHFRVAPSLKSDIIRTLPTGTSVEVLEKISGVWYRVTVEDEMGYIHHSRLALPGASRSAAPRPAASAGLDSARREAMVAFCQKNWGEVVRLLQPWANEPAIQFNDLFLLGSAYRELKQPADAAGLLEKAIVLHRGPSDGALLEAHKLLGTLYLQLAEPEKAVKVYEGLLARVPGLGWAILGKGDALLVADQPTEALEEYLKAYRLAPDDPQPYLRMGYAFIKLKDYDKAERSFREILRHRLDQEAAYLGLNQVLQFKGRLAEARKLLEQAVDANPSFAEARRTLARMTRLESLHGELAKAQQEAARIEEKIRLSNVSSLTGTIVARLKSTLYELKLSTDEHVFLNARIAGGEPGTSFDGFVVRGKDAKISDAPNDKGAPLRSYPYFRQATAAESEAYENMQFKLVRAKETLTRLEYERQRLLDPES